LIGLALGGSEGATVGSAALARCRTSAMFVSCEWRGRWYGRKIEAVINRGGEERHNNAKAELLSAVFCPNGFARHRKRLSPNSISLPYMRHPDLTCLLEIMLLWSARRL
jgi:hypothetical protein